MSFDLKIAGRVLASYDTEDEAVAAASEHIRQDADRKVEIVDSATGRSVAPGSTERWRDDLTQKAGF